MPNLTTAAAVLIFVATYTIVAIGKVPLYRIDRAGAALLGGSLMVGAGVLSLDEAYRAVDLNTITLLLGMMIVVANLRVSGFFHLVNGWIATHVRHPLALLAAVVLASGVLSAFLVNDAICLVMTPLVLEVVGRVKRNPIPYLLAIAMSSNIGSVATITGNPQNILIGSISGIPYRTFLAHLGPIALLGLFVDWAVLHWIHLRNGNETNQQPAPEKEKEEEERGVTRAFEIHPAFPMIVSLGVLAGFLFGFPPALVAAAGGAVLLMQRRNSPQAIYGDVDWSLLMLFLGLFLIIGGAQQAGITQQLLGVAERLNLHNSVVFTAVVTLLSNIVSNVPAVMLLKGLIPQFHDPRTAWLMLAMSSTLAGNLTITGSVANIIVVEKARGEAHIGFLDYMKIGIPVTLATLAIGLVWLHFVHY